MHELTLLFGVAEQVGKVTEENGIDHIDAVVLDIGDLTAVIPEFMMDGYQVISDEYDFLRGSELIINRIKGIARCNDCGEDYYVVMGVKIHGRKTVETRTYFKTEKDHLAYIFFNVALMRADKNFESYINLMGELTKEYANHSDK